MVKTVLFILTLVFTAGMAGPAAAASVVALMSADVDAYREALRGFKETLRHRVVAEYDMQGDFDRGQKILSEIQTKIKPDLIFAIGVWALQATASQKLNLPVVYAMVLNPPSVVRDEVHNITGASMNVPVEQTIRLFKQLGPQIQRVGVVFDRTKTGYLVTRADAAAREARLQLVTREIRSSKEAIGAVDSLQEGGIDALWILPDETVLVPAVVQHMLLLSYRKRIPLLGISESQAQMGALLSLSFASSEDIGRQAGEVANSILGGKPPAEVPYTTARRVHLTVNLKAAQKLGMEIPQDVLAMAHTLIR